MSSDKPIECFSDRLQLRWLPSHPVLPRWLAAAACVACRSATQSGPTDWSVWRWLTDEDNEYEDFAGNLQETVPEVSPPDESQDSNSDDNVKRLSRQAASLCSV